MWMQCKETIDWFAFLPVTTCFVFVGRSEIHSYQFYDEEVFASSFLDISFIQSVKELI